MGKCISGLENLESFVEILQVIAEPNRVKILCLLGEQEIANQNTQDICLGICVCDIVEKLQKPQALVSHHLSMLKRVQLVTSQRSGKKIYYQLNLSVFVPFKDALKTVFHFE